MVAGSPHTAGLSTTGSTATWRIRGIDATTGNTGTWTQTAPVSLDGATRTLAIDDGDEAWQVQEASSGRRAQPAGDGRLILDDWDPGADAILVLSPAPNG